MRMRSKTYACFFQIISRHNDALCNVSSLPLWKLTTPNVYLLLFFALISTFFIVSKPFNHLSVPERAKNANTNKCYTFQGRVDGFGYSNNNAGATHSSGFGGQFSNVHSTSNQGSFGGGFNPYGLGYGGYYG